MFETEGVNNGKALETGVRKPALWQIGMLFFVVVALLVTIGFLAQSREFYSGILITEYVLILVPVFAFLFGYRYNVKEVLRLNKISLLNIFLIICIMVFAIPVTGVFNMANLWLVNRIFGKVLVVQPPIAADASGLLLNILVIGVTPAICEEIMFRGVIQRGFERFGAVKSILITALLFGLIHIDFQKLFGTFFLGALIGFIVYRTNSIYGGMVAHFTNNSVAVLAMYLSNKMLDFFKSSGLEGFEEQYSSGQLFSMFEGMSNMEIISFVIGWCFVVLFCVAVLTGLMIAFIRTTSDKAEKMIPEPRSVPAVNILWFLPGILVIGFKYVQQGVVMLGMK